MNFRIGMKVACVDPIGPLTKGRVYTVLGLSKGKVTGALILDVDCWANPERYGNGWYACRFRPIVDRKTDISIFKRMLVPSKQSLHDIA